MKGRWRDFSIAALQVAKTAGTNVKTVTRLMSMPLARARPRSGPILNCMAASDRKPNVMARPLVKMAVDDLHRALTMSAPTLAVVPRHSW